MPLFWLLVTVMALGATGYFLGRHRALISADGNPRNLHSLPHYYGANALIFTVVPSLLLMLVWLAVQPLVIQNRISGMIPESALPQGSSPALVMTDIRRLAQGLDIAIERGAMTHEEAASIGAEAGIRDRLATVGVALGSDVRSEILLAAKQYRSMDATGDLIMTIFVIALSLAGLTYAWLKTDRNFRARNSVEYCIRLLLIFASTMAILTTLGIALSLIFNTIEFFSIYPAWDFFTGLTWAPSFQGVSKLGIIPLLWGTLYISLIALLVAVPVGLLAAIYLSEYASPAFRAVAKPLLEVLAGIPTIVYGLFALLTVGPMLVEVFGDEGFLGLGWMQGGTAVMTAGLVMGIMIIPFVSSLSDDIINAVPQAMRDASLGLGATHSETVKMVILPAALPGIVGAILLAASRAIGETMIVVMGAGAAASLSMNPFDAMTTVTAKIVSQLTGDADFASPEALVAFPLGMTLFVITLGLNILALRIVRKYREQYE